uniref:Uncharacterized protein n=1 Tax=Cannabis sativa TaxID=3483 RepID=A0A803P0B8_CANSA
MVKPWLREKSLGHRLLPVMVVIGSVGRWMRGRGGCGEKGPRSKAYPRLVLTGLRRSISFVGESSIIFWSGMGHQLTDNSRMASTRGNFLCEGPSREISAFILPEREAKHLGSLMILGLLSLVSVHVSSL